MGWFENNLEKEKPTLLDVARRFATARVLDEVADERDAQEEKWGQQDHPVIGGWYPDARRREYARAAASWKDTNDERVAGGNLGFDGILLEEAFEALEETDPVKIRAELVQVAAVAVGMIEALDRKISGAVAA